MKLSNTGAGMKSREGENDKTGNLKHSNSSEPSRRTRIILSLRVLLFARRCCNAAWGWCLCWNKPQRKEECDIFSPCKVFLGLLLDWVWVHSEQQRINFFNNFLWIRCTQGSMKWLANRASRSEPVCKVLPVCLLQKTYFKLFSSDQPGLFPLLNCETGIPVTSNYLRISAKTPKLKTMWKLWTKYPHTLKRGRRSWLKIDI